MAPYREPPFVVDPAVEAREMRDFVRQLNSVQPPILAIRTVCYGILAVAWVILTTAARRSELSSVPTLLLLLATCVRAAYLWRKARRR